MPFSQHKTHLTGSDTFQMTDDFLDRVCSSSSLFMKRTEKIFRLGAQAEDCLWTTVIREILCGCHVHSLDGKGFLFQLLLGYKSTAS